MEATEASRRNIVVLSEHFLTSEWSRYDYKSGLHQALRNTHHGGHKKSHSKRLIVILLGDVAQKKELLDPDIRMYLKTAVVIQWGDKLFWDKLR